MNLISMGRFSMGRCGPRVVVFTCAAALLSSFDHSLSAADDGALGARSAARLTVSLRVPEQIAISNLDDIRLTSRTGQIVTASAPACIFTRGGSAYELIARGSGPAAGFQLSNSQELLTYELRFDDGTGPRALVPNTAIRGLDGSRATSQNCKINGNNARLTLLVPPTTTSANPSLPAAESSANPPGVSATNRAGVYSGHLTLVVAPD